jgi:hypothetical protein
VSGFGKLGFLGQALPECATANMLGVIQPNPNQCAEAVRRSRASSGYLLAGDSVPRYHLRQSGCDCESLRLHSRSMQDRFLK